MVRARVKWRRWYSGGIISREGRWVILRAPASRRVCLYDCGVFVGRFADKRAARAEVERLMVRAGGVR